MSGTFIPPRGGAAGAGVDASVARLRSLTASLDTRRPKGRIVGAMGTIVRAVLPDVAIGELCRLTDPRTGHAMEAEVVGLAGHEALLTPTGDLRGLSAGAEVVATGRMREVTVGDGLLGRVLDGMGQPLDGRGPITRPGARHETRPLHAPPPPAMTRSMVERPLPLGLRAMDGLLTCAEGQRIGIYGEAGGGKSTLVSQIVKGSAADVAVVALVGERGREVREFIERSLGEDGLARSVVVVATSDRPATERVSAALTATAVAEHFRDRGARVLLFVDSVTRYARALREIGLAAGEPPTRRGFPPSVFASLPQLLERAGMGETGSITAFYAVLVEGDGQGDPIAEETRSILDGHVILSRELAAAGHYPAIDVLTSRSRVMPAVASAPHMAAAARLRALLARYAEVEFLIQVGEYKPGGDALADEAVGKIEALRAFLRQGADERTEFGRMLEWMARLAG